MLALLAGSTATQVVLLHWVFDGPAGIVWYVVLGAPLVLAAVTLFRFHTEPTAKTRKANEGVVSLSMLMSYVIVVAAIIVERGLSWG